MLYDANGRPFTADPPSPHKVEDPLDGYTPERRTNPEYLDELRALVASYESGRMDADLMAGVNMDGFANELTGLGTVQFDKTLGGRPGGPAYAVYLLNWWEAEARYRGSDLGRNIVEKIPDEMTRRGWDIEVQPAEDDISIAGDAGAHVDACQREPRRAAAGWRKVARSGRLDGRQRTIARERARRWDAVAAGEIPAAAAPPPPPGPLPKVNDEGTDLVEAMEKWADQLHVQQAVNTALRYERAYGGGCIFIGVDDGDRPLTEPLDPDKVRAITHLTVLRGGVDGEAVMWRPYNDPRRPKYGDPEIYQIRNTSVQLARPPAPGEGPVSQTMPLGPGGSTIFWVHETRLLVFNGEPTSRDAQQQMRGWGDSVFTRVNQSLSQYEQSWQAVTVLMQEASIATLAIPGFAKALAEKGPAARASYLQYAQMQALLQSVAKMRYIDKDQEFKRESPSLTGLAEILREMATKLAAGSDEPVSVMFGNLSGGLGAKEDPSMRSFYDRIEGKQETKLRPVLEYLYRLMWRAKNSPTKGHEPERWGLYFRPLWQLTELEQADLRQKTSAADASDITAQIVTPEEVAATRYGGPEYNPGPIVLDLDARTGAHLRAEETAARNAANVQQQPNAPGTPGFPAKEAPPGWGAASEHVPPLTAMPSDPITAAPTSTPSEVRQTGAGGKPLPPKEQIGSGGTPERG